MTFRAQETRMKMFLKITSLAVLTFGLFAADIAGTWRGSMNTQMGQPDVAIIFQPGTAMTGKVEAGEYGGPIEDAKIEGDNISCAANIGPGTLKFRGTVAGDEMKLMVTGTQGDQYKLVCKRQK
jgi:hypothetical protein